jgi:alkylhydroperoxidase/carboxymuconolactone decarboxylase family protein YurZ
MDDCKEHLRRLAMHDDALVEVITVDGSSFPTSVIDEMTEALMRIAATVSVNAAPPSSFQHAVSVALAAGATRDEVLASLEAVTPVKDGVRTSWAAQDPSLAGTPTCLA